MNRKIVSVAVVITALLALPSSAKQARVITENVAFSAQQVRLLVDTTDAVWKAAGPAAVPSPRATDARGNTRYTSLDDWTSGFFPGTLWYLYELTGEERWMSDAVRYTEGMERIKYYKGNHDIGFMINCSFGNGYRLTGKSTYPEVVVTAAKTLCERFRPGAGVIQSWNPQKGWKCPVIIDNMMNLELLFEATRFSGDSTYWNVAISHADKTMANHYRPDYSCYHVVDYDPQTGATGAKQTHQGYADASAWARGQAWGLYGFTLCYRYTHDVRYLEQAVNIARFWFSNPNLPADLVPYWDFDAPGIPNELRDASAAAIVGSALYELSTYVPAKQGRAYKKLADRIVESLGSPAYRAPLGENGDFVLMHSVGSQPHNAEMDVPLVYADYYFLEALKRKRDLEAPKK